MTSESASWKAAAQKADAEAAEDKRAAEVADEMEAELAAAEARIEAAEARYKSACKMVAEELAKPLDEPTPAKTRQVSGDKPDLAELEAMVPLDACDRGTAVSKGSKNAGARTDKEVSREKWLADRAAEGRVRNKAKKCREKLRLSQRDKRLRYIEGVDNVVEEEAPAPAPSKQPTTSPPKERNPLYESDDVKQGAKSLSERLTYSKDIPSAAEQKAAAVKVLTAGRENYFSSEPSDVLADLEKRDLVDAGLAKELHGLLKTEASKSAPIPPEKWLAHAQKVSGMERKDDQPYKESEVQYLKWVDRVDVMSAEAELDAAHQQLEELLKYIDDSLPVEDEIPAPADLKTIPAEQKIDEDYAAQLEEQYDPERRSKGLKNTSALPEKVASHEKWLKDRGVENREFEKNIKAREARREEARDKKAEAADVPDDA